MLSSLPRHHNLPAAKCGCKKFSVPSPSTAPGQHFSPQRRRTHVASGRADAAAAGRAQDTYTAGPRATPAARARLWAPTDGAQRRGAIGRAVRRRNAETHAQPHFGCVPLGGKTPTARQRGRRPQQILAARASPSWHRVGQVARGSAQSSPVSCFRSRRLGPRKRPPPRGPFPWRGRFAALGLRHGNDSRAPSKGATFSLSLSLSHLLTHSLTHSLTHTNTHTHTLSLSL